MFPRCLAFLAMAILMSACPNGAGKDWTGRYQEPDFLAALPWPTEEWTVSTPEEHGMDSAVLSGARDYAAGSGRHTQGVVVVRHNVIVAEWYFGGANAETPGTSWSVAKSFASALVGIAIGADKISGLDMPLANYYPDWAGTDKAEITLRQILSMTSGLDWNEGYEDNPGDSDVMRMLLIETDQLTFAAGREPAHEPGTYWSYSSGDSMLLSGVLEGATGDRVSAYADEVLFSPIGMKNVLWDSDQAGHTLTYCCINTPSRQFAKFGLLYLRGGKWGDRQVVPADWVKESTSPSQELYTGYGYQWWLYDPGDPNWADTAGFPQDLFLAWGHHSQKIIVIPSLDLVVVRNGVPWQVPDDWNDGEFLKPVLDSIKGE
ncbi:MAG: serine hydrolase [Proteobacteria bacterium]|nr:serine hydrolase [Pseudomonadota bacterium]